MRAIHLVVLAAMFVQSEKQLVYDCLLEDLYDKIRRLEEDRHNVDITSGTCILLYFFILELCHFKVYFPYVTEKQTLICCLVL